MKASAVVVAALITMGFWVSSAPAINYGDLPGDTVIFRDITESSYTDPLPLYGAPSVVGDTLLFQLPNFGSYSAGVASDLTDGMLSTTIESLPGSYIGYVRFREYGDVSLSGAGTAATYAEIANSIFLQINEIDGIPISPVTTSVNTVFSPSNGDWNLADDGIQTGTIWRGDLYVDLAVVIAAHGLVGNATKVQVTMDNTLNTASELGTSALIRKKETDGLQITPLEVIPEPATLLILGVGGALLALVRRGRKA